MRILKDKEAYLIPLLLLAAFVLRIYNLAEFDLWFDEATAALEVRSLFELPSVFAGWDILVYERDYLFLYNHLFLHFWKNVFGDSVFIMRLSSVLFGVFSLLAAYFMIKVRFGKRNAFFVFLFLCISPIHIYYSRELKSYAALMFFGFMFYYFIFSFCNKKNYLLVLGFFLCGVLAVYCHYMFLLFMVMQFMYMFWNKESGFSIKLIIGVFVSYLILLFPLLLTLVANFLHIVDNTSLSKPLVEFPVWFGKISSVALFYTVKNFTIGYFCNLKSLLGIFDVFLVGALSGYVFIKEEKKFIISIILSPVLVFVFSCLFFNFYVDRYFLIVVPFLLLYIVKGIFYLNKKAVISLMTVFIGMHLIGTFSIYGGRLNTPMEEHLAVTSKTEGFEDMLDFLLLNFEENDMVFNVSKLTVLPLKYYSRKKTGDAVFLEQVKKGRVIWFDTEKEKFRLLFYEEDRPVITGADDFDLGVLNGHGRVWIVAGGYDNRFHPTRKIASVLGQNFEKRVFKDVDLYLYD